ncbi:PAS domain-containing sensor histidine kinase [Geomesophilobacter sediminis]|uniref:histidine kinase n=1 Tax=Geomesophilobacter sediminis TaxID=2798584 RepID=A0A8J7J5A2_9BACT|nr:ATP-binding protein [Geomesophilobacter sediminis]MBJ6726193.1 PAS domain S-box protein [Geomesophilobacter sediminis]
MAPDQDATYRELFESDPRPMWVRDPETQAFLAVNDAALALLGYQRAEFLSLTPRRLAPEGDRRHLKKDGSAIFLELSERPVSFGGKPARLVQLREAPGPGREAELERCLEDKIAELDAAQKELEAFSYSVSHDLRAPLRHIDGFSKALLDDYAATLNDEAREYLARIARAAQSMAHILDHLLRLGRVARQEMQVKPVNLSTIAQVISLELKHATPERQVEFVIREGVTAPGDAKLLRVLLEALIENAWKFTSKKPAARIEFGVEEVDGKPVYLVRDDGAGFDMEYADKLFAVFQRLHRADEFEGCGVGLAIAQRVVKRHGGRIWGEGEVGRGAVFRFTLQGD